MIMFDKPVYMTIHSLEKIEEWNSRTCQDIDITMYENGQIDIFINSDRIKYGCMIIKNMKKFLELI
jgi:hypothetical protein